mgnify:CR=1 FL=1
MYERTTAVLRQWGGDPNRHHQQEQYSSTVSAEGMQLNEEKNL